MQFCAIDFHRFFLTQTTLAVRIYTLSVEFVLETAEFLSKAVEWFRREIGLSAVFTPIRSRGAWRRSNSWKCFHLNFSDQTKELLQKLSQHPFL